MRNPSNILFITSNLGSGGAERAMVNLINHLDRNIFKPHLALFQKEGVFLEKISDDVPVYEIQPRNYGFLNRTWTRVLRIQKLSIKLNQR